jgi:hypothetical protein
MRLSWPLAFGVVMLVTTSAAAHGRVFVRDGGSAPVHRITLVPAAVVVAPGFVAVSAANRVPPTALVIAPQRAIRPGIPVLVTRPSAAFFPRTVMLSSPVPGAFPHRVAVAPRRVGPKVILVGPTGSIRQR